MDFFTSFIAGFGLKAGAMAFDLLFGLGILLVLFIIIVGYFYFTERAMRKKYKNVRHDEDI